MTSFFTRILFNRYCLWMLTFVNERVCENPLTNIFWMDRNLTIARFHPNDTYILMVWSRKEACRVISLHPTSNCIKKNDTNGYKCYIFSKHYWNKFHRYIVSSSYTMNKDYFKKCLIHFISLNFYDTTFPCQTIPSHTRQRKEI